MGWCQGAGLGWGPCLWPPTEPELGPSQGLGSLPRGQVGAWVAREVGTIQAGVHMSQWPWTSATPTRAGPRAPGRPLGAVAMLDPLCWSESRREDFLEEVALAERPRGGLGWLGGWLPSSSAGLGCGDLARWCVGWDRALRELGVGWAPPGSGLLGVPSRPHTERALCLLGAGSEEEVHLAFGGRGGSGPHKGAPRGAALSSPSSPAAPGQGFGKGWPSGWALLAALGL